MAEGLDGDGLNAIQVCVRVRPLNNRELHEGHRICVSFDEATRQVVLAAVDKNTLLQLRGDTARGYAFDRRYGMEHTSDNIYEDCVSSLVESCFKGYNATVLAYGQTGSGKTHTMSGGVGILGLEETGITRRAIQHIFSIVDGIRQKQKPGENIEVSAYALELYNEELRDLAPGGKAGGDGLKLQERPMGRDGRVIPEVIGVKQATFDRPEALTTFFEQCFENRTVAGTNMNAQSSRSHAIYSIVINRTIVEVVGGDEGQGTAKVRTIDMESKFHMVDLAGSERVKRSGVTGKEFKEATHINGGLLALGNVIVALSSEDKEKRHIPYRDSKLTRLLQDSLGGGSLTVLISCISPSEADFEETNNTLKYANRACHIKNTPLPNKFLALEEDLLPCLPVNNGSAVGMVQLQALLADHAAMKEARERRDKEKAEKEAKRMAELQSMRTAELKKPGFQRLRAAQYDELRRQAAGKGGATTFTQDQVIGDDSLKGLYGSPRKKGDAENDGVPSYMRSTSAFDKLKTGEKAAVNSRRGTSGSPEPLRSSRQHYQRSASARAVGRPATAGEESSSEDEEGPTSRPDHRVSAFSVSLDGFNPAKLAQAEDQDPLERSKSAKHRLKRPDKSDIVMLEEAEKVDQAIQAYIPPAEEPSEDSADTASEALPESSGRNASASEPMPEAQAPDVSTAPGDSRPGTAATVAAPGTPDGEVPMPWTVTAPPEVLARFRINQLDTVSVYQATSKEDFQDVIKLLPPNTPLPASDKMSYLLARLEANPRRDLASCLKKVADREGTMTELVGPAVGCLMATCGTNMISTCIFEFEDPEDAKPYGMDQHVELWGLQIPHNSLRPALPEEELARASQGRVTADMDGERPEGQQIHWSSVDRLNMSIGLLYALCNYSLNHNAHCGFCVPRPQLLKRWLQQGVKMKQIATPMRLIYPATAHDYAYYKASTVAYFLVHDVKDSLQKVLSLVET